jgi:hypothetical protein
MEYAVNLETKFNSLHHELYLEVKLYPMVKAISSRNSCVSCYTPLVVGKLTHTFTLAAHGLEECENHQFYDIYCVTLAYVLYFEEISDSQFTSIHKSVGLVPFSAEYLICGHVRTDQLTESQTDKLIRVGLGPVIYATVPSGKLRL